LKIPDKDVKIYTLGNFKEGGKNNPFPGKGKGHFPKISRKSLGLPLKGIPGECQSLKVKCRP
jgi:hypothetical protein